MKCDQCQAAMINGVFCHETGCPNRKKTWVEERQEWVLFLECFECGTMNEEGLVCSCQEPVPDDEEETEEESDSFIEKLKTLERAWTSGIITASEYHGELNYFLRMLAADEKQAYRVTDDSEVL